MLTPTHMMHYQIGPGTATLLTATDNVNNGAHVTLLRDMQDLRFKNAYEYGKLRTSVKNIYNT